ncbi:MAG: hypothetical protein ACHQAX_10035 [Gammaproteobacteria bacterium]
MDFTRAFKNTLLACACIISISARASINSIVFSDNWLIRPSSDSQAQYIPNACQVDVFDYTNIPTGNKNDMVKTAYNSQYKGGNCTYVPGTPINSTPLTFPKGYSFTEYLRLHPGSPQNEAYFYLCDMVIDNKLHTINFVIEPIYECKSEGCYTGHEQCIADIAGRDLDIPGLGNLGHTGLTTRDAIVEVLDEDEVIQINPWPEFKTKTKYWGRAYGFGKPGKVELDYDQANAVIAAGWDQSAYYPQYTLMPEYIEGNLQYNGETPELVRGVFRCDTFVQYAYKKALNIDLLPEELYHAPTHQFSAIPFKRVELTEEDQIAEFQTNELYEKMVSTLNSSGTKEEKSIKILRELTSNKSANDRILIFDALRFAPTAKNIPVLLDEYAQASDAKEKLMILSALISSLQNAKWGGVSQRELDSIQDLYTAILVQRSDQVLYQRALEDLPTVYGKKEGRILLKTYGPDIMSETNKTLRRAYLNTYFLTATQDADADEIAGVISQMNGCELMDHRVVISWLVEMGQLPASTTSLLAKQSKEKMHLPSCPHSGACQGK